MYTFTEQLIMIIHFVLLAFGSSILYDSTCFFTDKLKLWAKYLLEFIFWLSLTIIDILYILKVTDGYIPIQAYGFFLLGIFIYYHFFHKLHYQTLLNIQRLWRKKIKKIVIILIIPKEVFHFIASANPIVLFKKIKRRDKANEKNSSSLSTSG